MAIVLVLVLDRGALCAEQCVWLRCLASESGVTGNRGQALIEDEDDDHNEDDWFEASCVSCVCIVKSSGSASLALGMFMKRALSQGVIFGKGLVVPMFVTAAVRTSFRSKCF
jgi:hypothetical protein